jgi:hypothetical protein
MTRSSRCGAAKSCHGLGEVIIVYEADFGSPDHDLHCLFHDRIIWLNWTQQRLFIRGAGSAHLQLRRGNVGEGGFNAGFQRLHSGGSITMRAAHLARLIFVHHASALSFKFEPLVPTDQSSNRNPSTCC